MEEIKLNYECKLLKVKVHWSSDPNLTIHVYRRNFVYFFFRERLILEHKNRDFKI